MRRMFLNGTAMSGQKDHGAIAGATFVGPARTAPRYRFFAVRDEFPGLFPVPAGGAAVDGELYELTEAILFGSLLPEEPAELEIGTIELEDGSIVNSMHLQPERIAAGDKVVDITGHGGWRTYQRERSGLWSRPPSSGVPRATGNGLDGATAALVGVLHRVHAPAQNALVERRHGAPPGSAGIRDLPLVEAGVAVDGGPVSAALYDTAVAAEGDTPLALPPLLAAAEGEWWDAVLADLERRLARPVASLRVTATGDPQACAALRERLT